MVHVIVARAAGKAIARRALSQALTERRRRSIVAQVADVAGGFLGEKHDSLDDLPL